MKRIFPMVGLAAILMSASACGLLDETGGDCPMVENEDIYSLTFEVDGDTPITDHDEEPRGRKSPAVIGQPRLGPNFR